MKARNKNVFMILKMSESCESGMFMVFLIFLVVFASRFLKFNIANGHCNWELDSRVCLYVGSVVSCGIWLINIRASRHLVWIIFL